jgi:hypothetical protein
MSTHRKVIDLTEDDDHYVEVRTRGGIIRVTDHLVSTRSGLDRVVVDVEPNTDSRDKSGTGGHWDVDTHSNLMMAGRLEIRLTRRDGS